MWFSTYEPCDRAATRCVSIPFTEQCMLGQSAAPSVAPKKRLSAENWWMVGVARIIAPNKTHTLKCLLPSWQCFVYHAQWQEKFITSRQHTTKRRLFKVYFREKDILDCAVYLLNSVFQSLLNCICVHRSTKQIWREPLSYINMLHRLNPNTSSDFTYWVPCSVVRCTMKCPIKSLLFNCQHICLSNQNWNEAEEMFDGIVSFLFWERNLKGQIWICLLSSLSVSFASNVWNEKRRQIVIRKERAKKQWQDWGREEGRTNCW